MTITCVKCKKEFQYKYLLKRHSNRKNPCIQVENEIIPKKNQKSSKNHPFIIHSSSTAKMKKNEKKNEIIILNNETITQFKCNYCKNLFSIKNSLYKHINELRCKKIPKSKLNLLIGCNVISVLKLLFKHRSIKFLLFDLISINSGK